MSQHVETTADVEMHSLLVFHRSYYEISYFSAWVYVFESVPESFSDLLMGCSAAITMVSCYLFPCEDCKTT